MIVERNFDVVERLPEDHLQQRLAERAEIEREEQHRVADLEQARVDAAAEVERKVEAKRRRDLEKRVAELEEENRLRSICTCPSYPTGSYAKHELTCPAKPEKEREVEAKRHAERLEKKVTEIRKNGLLLNNGRASA